MNVNPPAFKNNLGNIQSEILYTNLPQNLDVQAGMRYRILSRQPINVASDVVNLQFATDEVFLCNKNCRLYISPSIVGIITFQEYVSIIGYPDHVITPEIGFNSIQFYSNSGAAGASPHVYDLTLSALFNQSKLHQMMVDEIIIRILKTKDTNTFNEGLLYGQFQDMAGVAILKLNNPSPPIIVDAVNNYDERLIFHWQAAITKQALYVPRFAFALYYNNVGGFFANLDCTIKTRMQ